MSRNTFKVMDAVTVSSSKSDLVGIVAYVGNVKFAEGGDWIGVRLTGDSVGLGKNDGIVKGIKYFDTSAPLGGVFVKKATLQHRDLNRSEELMLKREIKIGGSRKGKSSSSRSLTSRRPKTASSSRDDGASVQSVLSTLSSNSNKSRLEERRKQRLAYTSKRSISSFASKGSKTATTNPATPDSSMANTPLKDNTSSESLTSPSQDDRIEEMQLQIDTLNKMNQAKENENLALQKSLQDIEKAVRDENAAKEEAETALENFRRDAANAAEVAKNQITNLQTTNTSLTNTLTSTQTQLTSTQTQLTSTQTQLTSTQSQLTSTKCELDQLQQTLETERTTHQNELDTAHDRISTLQDELKSLSEQVSKRDEYIALRLKENAQAEVSKWLNKVQDNTTVSPNSSTDSDGSCNTTDREEGTDGTKDKPSIDTQTVASILSATITPPDKSITANSSSRKSLPAIIEEVSVNTAANGNGLKIESDADIIISLCLLIKQLVAI